MSQSFSTASICSPPSLSSYPTPFCALGRTSFYFWYICKGPFTRSYACLSLKWHFRLCFVPYTLVHCWGFLYEKKCCSASDFLYFSEKLLHTLPIAKKLSAKNARAWVSIVFPCQHSSTSLYHVFLFTIHHILVAVKSYKYHMKIYMNDL